MDQLLRNIVYQWWEYRLPEIKPREIDLTSYISNKIKKIICVVGFRRVGKTFLLFDFARKIGQKNCLYINFEDERLPKKTIILTKLVEIIQELIGDKPFFLLLDEVQNIPDWSRFARRINDTTSYTVIVSGSSSRLSSAEIPTELRGRTLSVEVSPLTFSEFLHFNDKTIDIPKKDLLYFLRQYLLFGGLPEITLVEEGKKQILLDEYYNTFIVRDIFERYHPRQKEAFRNLIRLLLNSTYITLGKLTNTLKSIQFQIGKSTISSYIHYLQSSYFFRLLEIHTPNVKKRIAYPKKIYCIDSFFLNRYATNFSHNYGHLMEQVVYQKLRKNMIRSPLFEIYYWKDYAQNEIDFVCLENNSADRLIQVTFASGIEEIHEREIKALLKGSHQLHCNNLLIITWDLETTIIKKNKKILCIPLYHWLLSN